MVSEAEEALNPQTSRPALGCMCVLSGFLLGVLAAAIVMPRYDFCKEIWSREFHSMAVDTRYQQVKVERLEHDAVFVDQRLDRLEAALNLAMPRDDETIVRQRKSIDE